MLLTAFLSLKSVNVDRRIEVRLPLIMAPAERWRATGGMSEPSRCHGALFCLSLSALMAFSMVDSLLICIVWRSPVTSSEHILFENRFAELHSARRSIGVECLTIEVCKCLLLTAYLFGVNGNRQEKSNSDCCFCILPCSAECQKLLVLSCKT